MSAAAAALGEPALALVAPLTPLVAAPGAGLLLPLPPEASEVAAPAAPAAFSDEEGGCGCSCCCSCRDRRCSSWWCPCSCPWCWPLQQGRGGLVKSPPSSSDSRDSEVSEAEVSCVDGKGVGGGTEPDEHNVCVCAFSLLGSAAASRFYLCGAGARSTTLRGIPRPRPNQPRIPRQSTHRQGLVLVAALVHGESHALLSR